MMLLDSNIIIYSALQGDQYLRDFIATHSPFVSDVSRVEVLGYHKLANPLKEFFEVFFASASLLPISEEVVARAIGLRQLRKMTLGDSIIAANAIVHELSLVTNNAKDFRSIGDLEIINPLEDI